MSEEPLPGDSPEDREVARRWRQQSSEEPSLAVDKRIRDAARADGAASPKNTTGRVAVGSRWRRFAPLAAAASVALLAVGLVRLMPREEYQAITPRPDVSPSVAPPRAAPEAKAVSREGVSQDAPTHEGEAERLEADDAYAAPPAARPEPEAAPPVAQPPHEPAVAETQGATERPSSPAAALPSTRAEARRSAPTTAREAEAAAGLSAIATTAADCRSVRRAPRIACVASARRCGATERPRRRVDSHRCRRTDHLARRIARLRGGAISSTRAAGAGLRRNRGRVGHDPAVSHRRTRPGADLRGRVIE